MSLRISRSHRLFDSRTGEYLREPGREAAARRLRHEFSLLTDREAAAHVLEQQIFAADLRLSTLYADQSAAPVAGRKPDSQTLRRIENEIAAMKDELSRLRARRSSISTRALELRHLAVRKLILSGIGGGARLKFISPASVPKGTTLEKVRGQIAELHADARAVADAPVPADHAKARAAAFIDALTRPINVRPALESDGDIYLPLIGLSDQQHIPDALGVLLWALGPRIKELVNAEIEECADPNRYSIGVKQVFVNGRRVVADGAITTERPGRPLRGPGYRN